MNHKNKKILVVDDEAILRELLIYALEYRKSIVVEIETPDLILLDVDMPKMDRLEVYMRLQANQKLRIYLLSF